ncbi:amidase [Microbacterium sp. X-17]|uniref:amidase n=1 Tax=Microbacterium sp. X-17 TaxID=3144404 RepID=UPI0031F531B2
MSEDLYRRGAAELAELIRTGQATSVDVVQAHLDRIEAVNPELNAITTVLADQALAEARAADERLAEGGPVGRLHGVPVTVKENIDVTGTPTTSGVPALAEAIAMTDSPVVARMRDAGAIVIGRTNLPDLGLRIATESSLNGVTKNPWHPARTAGGSSGGEASAIASGMSPLGVGNDIGGSLRNPAHCCGISSLKPTTGRVAHATEIPPEDGGLSWQLMLVNGPMARTVADVRLGFQVISGLDPRDPASVSAPLEFPGWDVPTKVAVIAEPPGGRTDRGVAEVVWNAAAHLADAGYEVEEITPPEYEAVLELWSDFLMTELRLMQPTLDAVLGDSGKQFLFAALEDARDLDLAAYAGLFAERRRLQRAWAAFLAEYPVILSPTWSQPAFEHGWDAQSTENSLATLELLRPVMPANALGLPAAATPGGIADGMPVGVQLITAAFREDQALRAAAVIEDAVGLTRPVDPFVNY